MLCTIFGPLIAMAINLLKKVPVVGGLFAAYPKVVAAIFSAAVSIFSAVTGHSDGAVISILKCAGEFFAGAVATHEIVKTGGQMAVAAVRSAAAVPVQVAGPAPQAPAPPRSPMGGA